jgi:polyphosphate glucokinase
VLQNTPTKHPAMGIKLRFRKHGGKNTSPVGCCQADVEETLCKTLNVNDLFSALFRLWDAKASDLSWNLESKRYGFASITVGIFVHPPLMVSKGPNKAILGTLLGAVAPGFDSKKLFLRKGSKMKMLAIDVGGTHVKVLVSGEKTPRKFVSGSSMTPAEMVKGVKNVTKDWKYEAISLGYPGPVVRNRPLLDPYNLGKGWVGFPYGRAFGCPVKILNDAAMQALGSYKKGRMLFLGLGTGLGTAMVVDGNVEPMELGHLPYKKGTYEDYVGLRGLLKRGKKKWRKSVEDVVEKMTLALDPDEVVLGGGNVKKLKVLPPRCRAGDNFNAFLGGFRMWNAEAEKESKPEKKPRSRQSRNQKGA